jgi:hypothetical protein
MVDDDHNADQASRLTNGHRTPTTPAEGGRRRPARRRWRTTVPAVFEHDAMWCAPHHADISLRLMAGLE